MTSDRPPPLARSARNATSWRRKAFAWGMAAAALVFVVRAVPLRDRCAEPDSSALLTDAPRSAPGSPIAGPSKVAISRVPGGCILHRPGGDLRLADEACARLACDAGLMTTLEGTHLARLIALLALYFLGSFSWAVRWRALLALANVRLGVLETWRITLESQAGGIVLPGGIGGDALRVGFVVGKGASVPTVIAAVLLDRAIGLVTMAGLAALFAAMVGGGELGATAKILGMIPVAFVAGLAFVRWEPVRRAPVFSRGPLARVARPVLDYLGDARAPRAVLVALAVSAVVSAVQLATIRGLVSALGATPLLERWVYVGATMAFIVGAIPALPGGWGTSDAAFVFFLKLAGLASSTALAVSLLYRLFWYASGGVGAVLYLLRQHAVASTPSPVRPPGEARARPPEAKGGESEQSSDRPTKEERAERNA